MKNSLIVVAAVAGLASCAQMPANYSSAEQECINLARNERFALFESKASIRRVAAKTFASGWKTPWVAALMRRAVQVREVRRVGRNRCRPTQCVDDVTA